MVPKKEGRGHEALKNHSSKRKEGKQNSFYKNVRRTDHVRANWLTPLLNAKYLLDSSAGEEYDPLQLLVVEEIVEGPKTSGFSKRIWAQIRIVTVNVTFFQVDFVVHSGPQRLSQDVVLVSSQCRQIRVDGVDDPLKRWFLTELGRLHRKN